MDFELTPGQQRLQKQIYAYLEEKVTPELEAELDVLTDGEGPLFRRFLRQLGADGWMGIGWPKEFGGQGRTAIEQYIFLDATLGYYRLPIPSLALETVGPTIMQVGSAEQQRKFLPAILKGELIIAICYTEPEAGTDAFSIRSTAIKDGDHYIINGQKVFTSFGHYADYFWLSARTDPKAAKKHQGISIFMIDAKSPGITVEPQWVMGRYRVNQEFFDNVRVPRECLVGEENQGSKYMVLQLSRERQSMVCHSMQRRWIEDVTRWAKTTRMNGTLVIERPWVKDKLAEMVVENEVLRLLNYRVVWMLTQGKTTSVESAMIKAFGTEVQQRALRGCLEIMGHFGQLKQGSKWAPLRGWMERQSQMQLQTTFGGGTNEVLRDIVATMGLGLMKSR